MPEAWGGGYIDNAYGDSPPPLVFGVRLSNKRQELSGTFLAVRGRPEEPERKNRAVDGSFHDILATCWVHCGDCGRPEACPWRMRFL